MIQFAEDSYQRNLSRIRDGEVVTRLPRVDAIVSKSDTPKLERWGRSQLHFSLWERSSLSEGEGFDTRQNHTPETTNRGFNLDCVTMIR